MIPHAALGILVMLGMGLFREAPKRTDAERLADIERAEQAAIARANNPAVIAAAERRERRRLKRLALS